MQDCSKIRGKKIRSRDESVIFLSELLELKGHSLLLHIVFICVAVVSFNPWCNMWLAIAPDFFSLSANPWYYITGLVCLILSIRGLITYIKLPDIKD